MTHLTKGQLATLLLAIVFCVGAGVHINSKSAQSAAVMIERSTPEGAVTHADFLADVEKRLEEKRNAQKEEEILLKRQQAKKESVECQFWAQQTPRDDNRQQIADKIKQHCEL